MSSPLTAETDAIARARELAGRARERMRGGSNRVAIVLLARAFHVLDRADGLDPWAPERLHAWAIEGRGETERDAVRFVLSVWNTDAIPHLDEDADAKLGPFDAIEAVARWDRANRAAFESWVADPWWP